MAHKSMIDRKKGNSLLATPQDYTVIDLETTGFSSRFDDIIEIGGIKYRDGKEISRYNQLIKPSRPIPYVIESMTGIKNSMVEDSPEFVDIGNEILNFLEDDIIVGHNVNFDINFLYDNFKRLFGIEFSNDYIDTLRLGRLLIPDIKEKGYSGYGLDSLHRYFENLNQPKKIVATDLSNEELDEIVEEFVSFSFPQLKRHRAIGDCELTNAVFYGMKEMVHLNGIDLDELSKKSSKSYNKLFQGLKNESGGGDESHIFFGKCCVFTGKLEEFSRVEAAQIVVNIGGHCENSVTKRTNFLIVGDMDYKAGLEGYETAKLKKAKKLIEEKQDLTIIPESAFYDLIAEYFNENR